MKYQGSKRRYVKYILPIMLKDRQPGQWYVEPFAGGLNSIQEVANPRLASDLNNYVMAANIAIRDGWTPPTTVSKEEFDSIKQHKQNYPDYLVGYVLTVCAFAARFGGSYARNSRGDNYAAEGSRAAVKQREKLQGMVMTTGDYRHLSIPPQSIIYCDPPYFGTRGYGYSVQSYDDFWEWCRQKTKEGHKVFISEYTAPEDFTCVWKNTTNRLLHAHRENHKKPTQVEKLFTYTPI